MTWSLLAPAAAVMVSLGALTLCLSRLRTETVALRESLRRGRATAVAADELERLTVAVAARAADIDREARRHRRSRRRRTHR